MVDQSEPVGIRLVDVPCPLCGGLSRTMVAEVDDFMYQREGTYRIVRCEDCRHLYLNPRPSDDSLMACYPNDYVCHNASSLAGQPSATNASEGGGHRPRLVRRALRRLPGLRAFLNWLGQEYATIVPERPDSERARLLEIGCGYGGYLVAAQQAGWIVDGVEPSETAVAQGRANGLEIALGQLKDAHIEPASREAAAMWQVLEHVVDPVATVQSVYEILVPGGCFLLSVPNAACPERFLFGRYWMGYDGPRHLQVFTAKRIVELLSSVGFRDVRVVHQANTRIWYGSIAAWGLDKFPKSQWSRRWMGYFIGDPPAWMRWTLLIPGKLLWFFRCSGRITVVARKPQED